MKASPPPDKSGVQHWLDALASNSCSQDEFLQRVIRLQADDTDVAWEALALLDQYARRKLISREVFEAVKTPLQHLSLGVGDGGAPPPPPALPVAQAAAPPAAMTPTAPTKPVPDTSRLPLHVGDVLRGRYRIVDVLRQDGSGALMEAIDELRVPVPGIRPRRAIELWQCSPQERPEMVQRLCNLQALSHPGIVRVFDVEAEPDVAYLVTEWMTGLSLQQVIEQHGRGRLALPVALTIVRTVASALAYAHSRDVCHGDVSAANIFITDAGEIRLKGFDPGSDWQVHQRSDRMAFAQLAYGLLYGSQWSGRDNSGLSRWSRLREPRGLTREQWRVLRDAMLGREGRRKGDVLTTFAGSDDIATGRVTLSQALAHAPASLRALSSGLAWGIVVAILIAATWFIVTQGESPLPAKVALPAASPPVADNRPAPGSQDVTENRAVPPVAMAAAKAPTNDAADKVATPTEVTLPTVPRPSPAKYSPALVDLPSDTLEVRGDQPVARIWVRRRGGLRAVTFRWWTETGSAKAAVDFGAVTPQLAEIPERANGVALMVPLVNDPSRREARTFYVKIDETGPDATLGERTLVQVTILPADNGEKP